MPKYYLFFIILLLSLGEFVEIIDVTNVTNNEDDNNKKPKIGKITQRVKSENSIVQKRLQILIDYQAKGRKCNATYEELYYDNDGENSLLWNLTWESFRKYWRKADRIITNKTIKRKAFTKVVN